MTEYEQAMIDAINRLADVLTPLPFQETPKQTQLREGLEDLELKQLRIREKEQARDEAMLDNGLDAETRQQVNIGVRRQEIYRLFKDGVLKREELTAEQLADIERIDGVKLDRRIASEVVRRDARRNL